MTHFDSTKEVIVLTEHFAPSTGATAQLLTDLVEDLVHLGVRLRVLTSTPGSTQSLYPIHRFSVLNRSSVGIFHKLLQGLLFFCGSSIWLLFNSKKNQTLLIVSNPPFIGLIGLLLSLLKKTRFIFVFQDVFPRSASLTGILPAQGPIVSIWRYLMKLVLEQSATTVVLSDSMISRCILEFGHNPALISIPNWAILPQSSKSKAESPLSSEWGLLDAFTIQYSGNFGRLHEILTILEAARLLVDQPIKFAFVGGGAKCTQITRYCHTYDLQNVIIKPYQPRGLLSDSLAACDMSVVSLIPGAEDTVAPSKLYGILASSRPVLLISSENSELVDTITASRCGVVIAPGDVTSLASQLIYLKDNPDIVRLMGANAANLYNQISGRSKAVDAYYRLMRTHNMI